MKCKYCGKEIQWKQINKEWIPQEETGERHDCQYSEYKKQQQKNKFKTFMPAHCKNQKDLKVLNKDFAEVIK